MSLLACRTANVAKTTIVFDCIHRDQSYVVIYFLEAIKVRLWIIQMVSVFGLKLKIATYDLCKVKWRDIRPSMVTHTQNLCSAFNPSKVHTHSSEHTPGAVGSHLCCSARGAVGGSVPCSRAPQSWYWGWRECCTFTLPPPTIPAGPRLEPATFGLRVQLSNLCYVRTDCIVFYV